MANAGISGIDASTATKLASLRELLSGLRSVAVAFSAGVDSTFLLHVAHEDLGDCAVAVTVQTPLMPQREMDEAVAFCLSEGIGLEIVEADVLESSAFRDNPPDRCYHCKRRISGLLVDFASRNGLAAVVEGSNLDDDGDYRPGHRAIKELGVLSPLREVGLTKSEIRALSRSMGLPTWRKPSFACLASRFPYGESITEARLKRVERAERWFKDSNLASGQLRVRSHGDIARIEVPPEDIPALALHADEIAEALKIMGFAYVTLDLRGYRTGSMNETLMRSGLV